ncbi:MAG: DedA family protein [Nanoarchaeota archaeon]
MIDFLPIDFILHIDKYVGIIIQNYGLLAYFILFLIIFCETGFVVTPFLPGDSLLFVAGTFAAADFMNIFYLFIILSVAAIFGDSLNYSIGNYFGVKISSGNKWVRKEYLDKTHDFFEKHGNKAIVMARFVPIMRTFVPFVAGVGKMHYKKFLLYNVFGGILWVAIFLFAGFFFGGIPVVEKNLNYVILGIIFVSLIPIIYEFLRRKI